MRLSVRFFIQINKPEKVKKMLFFKRKHVLLAHTALCMLCGGGKIYASNLNDAGSRFKFTAGIAFEGNESSRLMFKVSSKPGTFEDPLNSLPEVNEKVRAMAMIPSGSEILIRKKILFLDEETAEGPLHASFESLGNSNAQEANSGIRDISFQKSNQDTLAEVTISAPKFPEKLARTGKVVTLISRAQIESNLGKSLGELLQEQVGIQVVGARSAPGSNQEVYVRGANTGHILLLIDGFPVNDPSNITQVMDWNLINLANIQRIEILKGGQSTLYGSDAMSAVINLVTQNQNSKGFNAQIDIQAGSFGTLSQQINVGGKIGKSSLKVSLQNMSTNGFSAARDTTKMAENDGFRIQSIRADWSRQIGKNGSLDLQYQGQNYRGNIDAGPFLDDRDYTSKAFSNSFRGQFQYSFQQVNLFFRGFQDMIDRSFRNDSTDVPLGSFSSYSESAYQGINRGLELYGKFTLPWQIQGILGGEFRSQATNQSNFSISSYGRYDSPAIQEDLANQSILGIYGTLQKEFGQIGGIELGTRWNKHSTFGNFSTFNFNPYLYYTNQGKVFFNFYTSFKTPSLYQLFSPYGNLNLKPEQGNTLEFGIDQKFKAIQFRIVGFQNEVSSGIVFQSVDVEPYGKYANVSKQNTQGIEAEIRLTQGKFSSGFQYTYLKGEIKNKVDGKDSTYSSLIRRPTHQWQVQGNYQVNTKLNVRLTGQFVGERKDFFYDESVYASVPKMLKSYFWTELQVGYQISEKWRINGLLKNVLNQEIVELYGYSGQMRNFQLSLLGRF